MEPFAGATIQPQAPQHMLKGRIKTTRCQFHCAACDRHFVSLTAFDAHILAPGVHRPPAEIRHLRLRTDNATCDHQHHGQLAGVPLWEFTYTSHADSRIDPLDLEEEEESTGGQRV